MNGEDFDKDFQDREHEPTNPVFLLMRDTSILIHAWRQIMLPFVEKEDDFTGPETILRIIVDSHFPRKSYDAVTRKVNLTKLVSLLEQIQDPSPLFFSIDFSRVPEKECKATSKAIESFEQVYTFLRKAHLEFLERKLKECKVVAQDTRNDPEEDEDVPELEE